MKKNISLITVSICLGSLFSQATISSSSFAKVGQEVTFYEEDRDNSNYPLKEPGSDKVWDFSTHSKDDTSVFKVIPKGWNPTVAAFVPNATFLIETDDSVVVGIRLTDDDLLYQGIYSTEYEDRDEPFTPYKYSLLTYPMTMGTSDVRSSNIGANVSFIGMDLDGAGPLGVVDSLEFFRLSVDTFNGVGYGSVKTPSTTIPDCIMVEHKKYQRNVYKVLIAGVWQELTEGQMATLNLDADEDSNTEHEWWSNAPGYGFLVASYEIEGDSFSDPTFMDEPAKTNGLLKAVQSQISAYPIPAKDLLNINTDGQAYASYAIYTMTGRLVSEGVLENNQINIASVSKGTYLLELKGQNIKGALQFIKE